MKNLKRKLCIMITASFLVPNLLPQNQETAIAATITYQDRNIRDQRMKESNNRKVIQNSQHRETIKKKVDEDNNINKPASESTEKKTLPSTSTSSNEGEKTLQNNIPPIANKNTIASQAYNEPNIFIGKSTYTYNAKNENDAYESALLDAKRNAVEQAGTHIQASSEINNFQLTADKVKVLSSAIVKLLPDSVKKRTLSKQGDMTTVELTAAFQVELDNLNTIAITLWPQVPKAKLKTKINSNSYRTPSPMTFQEAEKYCKNFSNDIIYHTFKTKDKFGNKNRQRLFDFLNKNGLYHSGSTITGAGNTSAIRFSIDYGFENISSPPVASVGWSIGSTGEWGSFRPKYINFVFDEGDTVTIPIGKVDFYTRANSGIFVTSILKQFYGVVVLTPQNLYELSNHKQLQAAYISNGNESLVHLFYSGDKDKREKDELMRGFHHASKILDITYETVTNLTKLQQDTIEAQRRSALLESVNKEIEHDKLKEEILTEIDAASN